VVYCEVIVVDVEVDVEEDEDEDDDDAVDVTLLEVLTVSDAVGSRRVTRCVVVVVLLEAVLAVLDFADVMLGMFVLAVVSSSSFVSSS
jgi:hypothetical protein